MYWWASNAGAEVNSGFFLFVTAVSGGETLGAGRLGGGSLAVAGLTVFFIAMEQGAGFAAQVCAVGLLSVPAIVCFVLVYVHTAQRLS
jgi:hypothetical protein